MPDLITSRPHLVSWKDDRQELRDEWAAMTMAERLESSAKLARDMLAMFGRSGNAGTTEITISRIARRKR